MSLIYITGVEGAGKSTVCDELLDAGYSAIDLDTAELAQRYFKGSWQRPANLPPATSNTLAWYADREWKVKPLDVQHLRAQAVGEAILFVCGITDNFDQIICLTLDQPTVRERLAGRTDNNFGKTPGEREYILEKHQAYEAKNKEAGSIMLDAAQPVIQVVNRILVSVALL